jgi:peptidoglycan/LPS O-acetylase OafA/YrhL
MFVFQSAVHGFRMPLFFIVSGFFTAMLWRTKGLKSLLWHRFRRVLLPCLVGLFTVVPLSNWVIGYAMRTSAEQRTQSLQGESPNDSIWSAIRKFDAVAVKRFLDEGFEPSTLHPEYQIPPLTWATLVGDLASVTAILDAGGSPNVRNADQNTPLHAAAFFGRADIASTLIERGAEVNARAGSTPLAAAQGSLDYVPFIAGLLSLSVDLADVKAGRLRVVQELERHGGMSTLSVASKADPGGIPSIDWSAIGTSLMVIPLFSFLWFLWFLWLYVVLFVGIVWLLKKLPWRVTSWRWIHSPLAIFGWMILTAIPTAWFDGSEWSFGPDTSIGLIPVPHVFAFYAIFFGFGILYYLSQDTEGRFGRSWRWLLPITFLILFPVALELSTGVFAFRDKLLPAEWFRPLAIVGQALFAWFASLGCIGWFRDCLVKENRVIRYISDASYWLYITHLPLVVWMQVAVQPFAWSAPVKLAAISIPVILVLLIVYHTCVRFTWIGTFLNGPRSLPSDTKGYRIQPQAVQGMK